MNFNDYQQQARETAIYPNLGGNLWYPALGLTGEAGEVAEKIKKIYRDKDGLVEPEDMIALCKELGDVLWYVANLGEELGLPLEHIAQTNLGKLHSRQAGNKLHGDGDNR